MFLLLLATFLSAGHIGGGEGGGLFCIGVLGMKGCFGRYWGNSIA